MSTRPDSFKIQDYFIISSENLNLDIACSAGQLDTMSIRLDNLTLHVWLGNGVQCLPGWTTRRC